MIDTSQFEHSVWIDSWDENQNPVHISYKNRNSEVVGEYKFRAKKKKRSTVSDLNQIERD